MAMDDADVQRAIRIARMAELMTYPVQSGKPLRGPQIDAFLKDWKESTDGND